MSKKYKELPASSTNDLKVGDKVYCYDSCAKAGTVYIIDVVRDHYVELKDIAEEWKGMAIHYLCCRKLEEVKPLEFWVSKNNLNAYVRSGAGIAELHAENVDNGPGYVKFREVLEDEE